jgi:hypothetical protein
MIRKMKERGRKNEAINNKTNTKEKMKKKKGHINYWNKS